MKKHIKTYLSIILALSMLLSMLPIYAAATDDEFEGLEIVEEIPFEFELEPGDLPLDMLADAVLPAADLPSYISASLAAERDHVNRLYLQEPDANTVMFQNRDGSKTIYVFSKPVKNTGLTLGTNALAVNGGKIAFSGNNIITNRIGLNAAGKQIQDYKIGYSDIQTLPGGVLTANGIDITEDVRNWAVSEFGSADAEYNISESAIAAYTASVSVIETELTANVGASASANAVTPGITITPINPSPATGATVMSITYSDLAGKMCFKNAETNAYLTLHPTTKNSLITTNNIYGTFSYWIVKYVAVGQYTICSYYDRTNKYIGVYYEDLALVLGTLNNLGEDAIFDILITSYVNSTIEIKPYYESDYAISSNVGLVHGDESDEFPDSCSWIITNRSDYVEVQSITPQSTTRIEQAGEDFYPEYTTVPSNATDTDIRMYYSDNNQEVTCGDYDDSMEANPYYITTPGIYTVYYKDTVTGVRSANFTLVIYDVPSFEIENSNAEATFSIQPASEPNKYLTMLVGMNSTNSLTVSEYAFSNISYTFSNQGEKWNDVSRAFTILPLQDDATKYNITSILTKSQYNFPSASYINYISYNGPEYSLTNRDLKPNTINITDSTINMTTRALANGINILRIENYYVIFSSTDDNILNNVALKYDEDEGLTVGLYDPTDTSFRWTIEQLGVNAPLIRQTQQYTCGPATFLQVLYGAKCGALVPEQINNNQAIIDLHYQMMTLAYSKETGKSYNILPYTEWVDVDDNHWMGGTTQNLFADRINCYSLFDNNATGTYTRQILNKSSSDNYAEIKELIMTSLRKGWAPFVWTDTGGIPYKMGAGGGHYICIIGFEETSATEGYVIIANCHYHDNILGIYAVPYSDFYQKIGELYYYSEQ